MLGGVFTSVVVPMLVRAAKEDADRGEGTRGGSTPSAC